MDDIWMNFDVWNKNSNKMSWIMLISSWICMKFYPWSFIHWRFMNDLSGMLIHKIWILFAQLFLLYLLPNSTLPNGEVQVTIWLFCKIDFSGLSSPLCPITESTVHNCQVHGAKLAFLSYQFHTTKAILPNSQVQICFVNCPQHKKVLGCPMSKFFQVCWNFCPKKSDPFKIQTTL